MSRLALVFYSLALAVVLVLAAPWWLWQMLRNGKYREGLGERLGKAGRRPRPTQPTIWVHAVSVGEVLAASKLIEELSGELSSGLSSEPAPAPPIEAGDRSDLSVGKVYISTTTRTGQALARQRFGAECVFYFPLDFAFAVRAWLRFLRPTLLILVESELWPRLLVECRRAGIPVAVVNARISDRSWPRYQRLRQLWQPLAGSLALVLAQSQRDAERWRHIGVGRVKVTGNLKYDVRVTAPAPITQLLGAMLPPGVPVVVCGSTLAGEEALLLDALAVGEIVVILAPRHPERFGEVARLVGERGLGCVRRSELDRFTGSALATGTVLLLDSIGELASVYALGTLAVLGGGLLWPGGHNPLEPAQFGVPVLMGSRYENFREIVEALKREHAVIIADVSALAPLLGQLLGDQAGLRALGQRGKHVFEQQAGATARTVAALLSIARTSRHAGGRSDEE